MVYVGTIGDLGTPCDWRYGGCSIGGSSRDAWTQKYQSWPPGSWGDEPRYEREAIWAAKTCLRAWLEERGGTEATEITNGIAAVREFINLHGKSRFDHQDFSLTTIAGEMLSCFVFVLKDILVNNEYLMRHRCLGIMIKIPT